MLVQVLYYSESDVVLQDVLRPVYLVSTVSEWLTALSIVFFVLTFYPSFKRISLLGPRVQLLEDPVNWYFLPKYDYKLYLSPSI